MAVLCNCSSVLTVDFVSLWVRGQCPSEDDNFDVFVFECTLLIEIGNKRFLFMLEDDPVESEGWL